MTELSKHKIGLLKVKGEGLKSVGDIIEGITARTPAYLRDSDGNRISCMSDSAFAGLHRDKDGNLTGIHGPIRFWNSFSVAQMQSITQYDKDQIRYALSM